MRYPFVLADGIDRTRRRSSSSSATSRPAWSGRATSCASPGFANIEHRAPEGGLPNGDRVMDHALSLPVHHGLTSDDVGHLAGSVAEWGRQV